MERAYSLEDRDDYEGALATAKDVLERNASYRPALQAVAHFLQLVNRDSEGLTLLRAAMLRFESEAIAAQLAVLESELGLFADVMKTLQRYRALAPLLEGSDEK